MEKYRYSALIVRGAQVLVWITGIVYGLTGFVEGDIVNGLVSLVVGLMYAVISHAVLSGILALFDLVNGQAAEKDILRQIERLIRLGGMEANRHRGDE